MSELEEENAFFNAITHVKAAPWVIEEEAKCFLHSLGTWFLEIETAEEIAEEEQE
jgi:hypothetical protein